jgi:hypothetical protein
VRRASGSSGRTAVRRAVAWACATFVLGAAVVAARATFAGAYGSGPFSFPHQPHLSPATVNAALAEAQAVDRAGKRPGGGGTVDRECRVCHDVAKGAESHLAGCDACHVDAKHLEQQVAPGPAAVSAFPHKEHLKDTSVTCFSCHRVQKEMGWIEFTIPEGGLGKAGAGGRPGGKHGEATCADCHRAHEPKGGLVKKDDVTGDGRACDTCHMGATSIVPRKYRPTDGAASGAAGDRPFLHADHGGADGDCARCHGAVRTSRTIWDYDPTAGTQQACESCHMDADGRPLVGVGSPGRTTKLPFVAFSRFPHESHLAPPKGEIPVSGKVTDGCRTCHFPERDAAAWKLFPGRSVSPEPVGRSQLVDYDSCVPCHQAWKVEGHGVGAWSCFKCHSGAADAQGKLGMAKSQVERASLAGGVQFQRHHHPGIDPAAAPLADATQPGPGGVVKECRDCHVGDTAALSSRLLGKTFRHEPHLPSNPTQGDCVACHTTSLTSSWSADLARFDAHLEAPTNASGASGRAKGCLVCHVGATAAQLNQATTRRTVPEFDHKGHATTANWKGASARAPGIPCTECHVAGGDVGYSTPQDVYDCTRCHSHDEKQADKFARTGKKSSTPDEAKACTYCHEEVRESVTPSKFAPRTHLSLLPGKQRHDLGGDCASCHARDSRPYQYVERIRKAKIAVSIHEDPALAREWFNDPRIAQTPDAQGRSCMSCHRFEPRGHLRALGDRR